MKENYIGIVGDGLIATHFAHYLDLEGLSYTIWSRKKEKSTAVSKLRDSTIILLLISDDSIVSFIKENPQLTSKTLLHFSGSLTTKEAIGFHPLMTFSKELYSLERYRKIPFVCEENDLSFKDVFPTLKNPYYQINTESKPLYHALCVLSGNFTTMLWQKTMNDFENTLNLPKEILNPYLDQVCLNIKSDVENALTGPIKRRDKATIKKNIGALQSRLWKKIYRLFRDVYYKGWS